jgi:hypothetical protein
MLHNINIQKIVYTRIQILKEEKNLKTGGLFKKKTFILKGKAAIILSLVLSKTKQTRAYQLKGFLERKPHQDSNNNW